MGSAVGVGELRSEGWDQGSWGRGVGVRGVGVGGVEVGELGSRCWGWGVIGVGGLRPGG